MTKTNQPFSTAKYESQRTRSKQRLARLLLTIAYPIRAISVVGDTCILDANTAGEVRIHNFTSVVCDHVPADIWEKLPEKDRYTALHLLVPTEHHTPVPGGMVYKVRHASKASKVKTDEWVFLTVGHLIGRCKLVPTGLAARVF